MQHEHASFDEPFDVTLYQRGTGSEGRHGTCHRRRTETRELLTTRISLFPTIDTCALATSKQQNHAKDANHEAAQPPELSCTDLPGRASSESQTNTIKPSLLANMHAWRLYIVLTAHVMKFRMEIDCNVFARKAGAIAPIDSELFSTHLHQPPKRSFIHRVPAISTVQGIHYLRHRRLPAKGLTSSFRTESVHGRIYLLTTSAI